MSTQHALDYDAIVRSRIRRPLHAAQAAQPARAVRQDLRRAAGSAVPGTSTGTRAPSQTPRGVVYRYSFDKDLLQEWDWNTRYLDQPDILAYLQHVVERYDLARDVQLNTEVTGAIFDEKTLLWRVSTADGVEFTSRYLVNSLGLLAKTNVPDIPGMDSFAGRTVHTNAWPDDLDITREPSWG